ncbi:hypothetical protein [Bosea sp. (in: a-proteobacteria)]|uniref:hypothetical protein n=1 Tax=Bosea sp. (in: a-proteobacteria) TaxID=1871050 RepID=UPI00273649AA|nr:hypothetical protein [Bosea sp. (in: a-proteobacteria)]MDP3409818.1 hypothetical protein [Bosea sp. (in: a-proteobacteria)]
MTPLTISLVLLAAKPVPQRFCEAFTTAARKAPTYQEAVIAAVIAVDARGDWLATLEAMIATVPSAHVSIMQGAAKEHGEVFVCPAFEFPSGKPAGKPTLKAFSVSGLAADSKGAFALTCPPSGCELHALTRTGSRLIVSGLGNPSRGDDDTGDLRRVGDELIVALESEIVSVQPSGAAVKKLATGLTRPHHVIVEQDRLLFAAGTTINAVSRGGGPIKTLFAGKALVMGSPEPVWFSESAGTVAFITWQGPLLSAKADGEARIIGSPLGGDVDSPAGLGGVLYSRGRSGQLVRLDPATGKQTAVTTKKLEFGNLVSNDRELLAITQEADWRAPQSIIAWRPGEPEFVVLVRGATARLLAATDTDVFWFDERQGAVMSAPRK